MNAMHRDIEMLVKNLTNAKIHPRKFVWRISEFTTPGLLEEEIIEMMRENNYPIPMDCPGSECRDLRPACKLGICKIAALICGDF